MVRVETTMIKVSTTIMGVGGEKGCRNISGKQSHQHSSHTYHNSHFILNSTQTYLNTSLLLYYAPNAPLLNASLMGHTLISVLTT